MTASSRPSTAVSTPSWGPGTLSKRKNFVHFFTKKIMTRNDHHHVSLYATNTPKCETKKLRKRRELNAMVAPHVRGRGGKRGPALLASQGMKIFETFCRFNFPWNQFGECQKVPFWPILQLTILTMVNCNFEIWHKSPKIKSQSFLIPNNCQMGSWKGLIFRCFSPIKISKSFKILIHSR